MKISKIIISLSMIALISMPVKAESLWELYKRDPQAFYEKTMCIDEESRQNGYYTEASRSYEQYKNDIPSASNSTSKNKSKSIKSTKSDQLNKGFVYGDDELHVVGTQSDSRGYTAAGYYGSDDIGGKGWVYDADELHVTGLPTDPETGYTKPGFYGNID